jgi:outer membrane protein assembly factor BamB
MRVLRPLWPLFLLGLATAGCGTTGAASPADPSPSPSATPPSEWPMYGHDSARTSRNPSEAGLTVARVGALAPQWQAQVGIGPLPPSCTPAVAGGRVFVGSSRTDGDNFFAFDARTGQRLWSASLGQPQAGTVGIGASPGVGNGIVVAGGADAAYYGLDAATGAIRWRHALDSGPNDFAWASPLISGNRVWIGVSSEGEPPGQGEVRLLDLGTGALVARLAIVPDGERGGDIWNSPALSPDGTKLVLATGNDFGRFDGALTRAIVALDPASLNVIDSRQEGTPENDLDFGTSPVVFGDAQGRTLVASNNKNGTIYAYDLLRLSAGAIWQRQEGISVGLMPAFDAASRTLWFGGDNGRLFAVDAATGVDRFPGSTVGFMNGNLALAGELVLANSTGRAMVLEASTGRLLRALVPDNAGRNFSGIAVAGGSLYWLSGEYLNAWGLP